MSAAIDDDIIVASSEIANIIVASSEIANIVECAYAPSLVVMSVLFLGEPLGLWLFGGGGLVLSGVLLAATDKIPTQRLEDPITPRRAVGATLAISGVLWIVVSK